MVYSYLVITFRTDFQHLSYRDSQKIIPTLDTVAGDACSRSSASKNIVMASLILIISPEFKQSFLLSSRTVFIFCGKAKETF